MNNLAQHHMLDEKLIIRQFLENQKLAFPSNLNAANLTLVLKSLGFFLNEFDVPATNAVNPVDNNLSIEIKCGPSGIVSKLYLPQHDCHCLGENRPEHKTYWEMHGNQPSSSSPCSSGSGSTVVHEAATNLLPEADHTWKILTKNMFNFIIRMQNDIAKYKDAENNMQYNTIETVEIPPEENTTNPEKNLEINEASPVNNKQLSAFKPDTPFSTPLSSINVTPIVSSNVPNIIVSGPSDAGAVPKESQTSIECNSTEQESFIISLVMEAKSKLDQALVCMKLTGADDFFNNNNNNLKSTEITPKLATLRRRSTNSSIGSNKSGDSNNKIPPKLSHTKSSGVGTSAAAKKEAEKASIPVAGKPDTKRLKSPAKRGTQKYSIPPTRTSTLRKSLTKN